MSAGRTPVQSAALRLARAVMREAGLRPAELVADLSPRRGAGQEKRRAAPVAKKHAGPQLVSPSTARTWDKGFAGGLSPRGGSVNNPKPIRADVPGVRIKPLPAEAEVVVPAHVKVQVCPSARDTRYTVDPATFEGGELVAEGRRKTAPARGKKGGR